MPHPITSCGETLDAPEGIDAPVPGPELAPGTLVGRYEVEALLGQGGQGAVYRARHVELGTPAAIKLALPEHDGSGVRRLRFSREALLGAQVRHRNVVSVFDVGEHEGAPYLVMELVEGESLADLLERRALSPAAAVELGLGLLAGLHALHARAIVHRDIKPENIVLHHAIDGDVVVKLLDFGVSKSGGGQAEIGATITRDGSLVGTPQYMSPEQLRGRPVDGRSDLYALSAVLYECLAGRPPHDADSLVEVLASVLNDPIPRLESVAPSCPPALAEAIHAGLAPDPDDRPAHPSIFAERLRSVARELGLDRGADAWASPLASDGEAAREDRGRGDQPMGGAFGWRRAGGWSGSALRSPGFPALAGLALLATVGSTAALSLDSAAEAPLVADAGKLAEREPPERKAERLGASVDALERQARSVFLSGDATAALTLFRRVVDQDPERARAWRDLGLVALDLRESDAARRAFYRYLSIEPDAPDAALVEQRLERLAPSFEGG